MPPKKSTTPAKKPVSGLTRIYLFLYNLISFGLWASCTLRTALLLPEQLQNGFNTNTISAIFAQVFPLLALTQSLAALEILHSLIGLVRAPVVTTAMQVASRFLVVWGVMFTFHEGAEYVASVPSGAGILGNEGVTQYGDYAFLGCMFAWGITECIRYGFFAMQLAGVGVPGFWLWLRYNTFFVLYPIGISSECVLIYLGLEPAGQFVSEYYKYFLIAMLGVYVPGSYILYTHMMTQRRKVMRGKSRVD
ncbi:putative phosphatase-like protein [Talaromyces proteolyticus]|uniref:Very-long-chain (3R)-3-hydroxyacyl-CoA dehydratase n=1 Tax=Talaromyces proteolyticus TaxID=1131652 RepID=A0AAD4KZX3_9EURO|nr:putative phosphatase-like protein [Talaromyces proteolyticus]KAH8704122.1 putative phosphatase-like protein [Talaromyces proteolyticus]